MAGHDLNYLALSGALELSKRTGEAPRFPVNLMGDFAGGSYYAVIGILLALLQRHSTNRGQVIDANIVDGTAYLTTFLHNMRALSLPIDVLQGDAPFYDVYETLDHNYITVYARVSLVMVVGHVWNHTFTASFWTRWDEVRTLCFKISSIDPTGHA
jgi:alpha-methylacyl-CoA racemase